ncbi:MAG: hypothetical protein ACRD3E_04540 [Terriglobales bacterium]
MSNNKRELALDTDKPTFVVMIVAAVIVVLSLSRDVYRWSRGTWLTPLQRPSGLFGWFPFFMGALTMVWFVAAFRDRSLRLLRAGCAFLLISYVIEGILFLAPPPVLSTTLSYIRPVFGVAALMSILVWLVSWIRGVAVNV